MKRYGAKRLRRLRAPPVLRASERDAETPPTKPARTPTAITLGNIDALWRRFEQLYGKREALWITEYGYQTPPTADIFGVSYAKQASYLKQAWAKAKANPRIDMFLWFLLQGRHEPRAGWQSGFLTADGARRSRASTCSARCPSTG